jgi:hypothetical protein
MSAHVHCFGAAAWSQPLGSNKQQDIAATSASPDIDEISSTANPIPRPFYTKGANLPRNGEPTVSPPTFGSDSQPTPTLLPALLGGVTLAEPPPPVESALIQTDHHFTCISISIPIPTNTRVAYCPSGYFRFRCPRCYEHRNPPCARQYS